ncbi:hypothetical protein [Kitasatospora purpeofusca]|uniref:hypothetical protein n=1 Tax=Kitasatospora purpeofusca TaxID=67352 RepID=UPI0036C34037
MKITRRALRTVAPLLVILAPAVENVKNARSASDPAPEVLIDDTGFVINHWPQ